MGRDKAGLQEKPVLSVSLQLQARRQCLLIVGKSGSGKSTFALRYLVADKSLECRFLFDPEGEFSTRLGLTAAKNEEELEHQLDDGFVIYDPHTMFPGRMSEACAWFCNLAFEASSAMRGSKVLLIDEAWRYCNPGSIAMPLANCIQTGRKRGLGMMFATQRPNRLNEAITNEVTECVCFRLQGLNALERVSEMGADTDEVSALPMGSFVALNVDSGGELRGRLW